MRSRADAGEFHLEARLRRSGLRVTRPRAALLTAAHHRRHSETESIIAAVREGLGAVFTQAVHDVRRALAGVVSVGTPRAYAASPDT